MKLITVWSLLISLVLGLVLLLLLLKLNGVAGWLGWWEVTAPIWLPWAAVVLAAFGILVGKSIIRLIR